MDRQVAWIESGKQVGKTFSFVRNGITYWSSVGIQKHDGVFKVYIDVIAESQMTAENYERDELSEFANAQVAVDYVLAETSLAVEHLTPCKGSKIFDPSMEWT
jgi:hypothetical protein